MTKPQVVEPKQLNHMLLAVAGDGKTKGYSQYPLRDKALLLVLYGTGMTATELAELLGISVSSARRLAGQDTRKMAGIVAKIGGSFP